MKHYLITVLIVAQYILYSNGQCIPNPNVTPGPNDPPLPDLPDSFTSTIEANIHDTQKTITAKEYVDYSNNRATLKMTTEGETVTNLFDYANDQLFRIDENNNCEVLDLKLSQDTILLGGSNTGGVPHVFTTSGVIHFMKKNGQVYKGPTVVRGVNTDHWSTCLVWNQLNATFTLDYFFTVQNWDTARGFPSIPVRAIATGMQVLSNGTKHQFQHYYEYVDFRVELDDYTVFETPKGSYCPGRKVLRQVPTVPSSFHFKAEYVSPQSTDINSYEIWYDLGLQLVRYDHRPSNGNPVREVHDFSTGIQYVTDIVTGNCSISPITTSTDAGQSQTGDYLKNANHFLFLNGNFSYSGKRLARNTACDVFTTRQLFPYNGVMYNSTLDFYFLSPDFNEYPLDGTTSPTDVPFRLEATITVPGMDTLFITYNYLSFDSAKRSVSEFDISACFSNMTSLTFQMKMPGPFRQQDTNLLMTEAHNLLPSIMNITKIRLQKMRVDFDPSIVYLTTTLLNIAPDYAKFAFATSVVKPSTTLVSTKDVDRSFDFTDSWKDCATRCVQSYDFICNSFDFCPSTGKGNCHIYRDRRTDIKTYLSSHTPPCLSYSVYQRTINGISNQETAVFDAYGYLLDAVNQKSVHIQTFDPAGQVTDYYPVEVEILSGVLEPQTDMPSLSGQFSFRQESTFPGSKRTIGSSVWYDTHFKLVRYDYVKPGAPYYTDDPLTFIQDFNAGVTYVIDSGRQNCTINALSNNVLDTQQNGIYRLKNPLELFHLNRTYKFAGQKSVRGMTANIFEAKVNDFKLDMQDPNNFQSTFQYYFLKDDWSSNSDSSFGTTSAQPIKVDILSVEKGLYLTIHYYDWDNHDPDLQNFNIVPCYTGDQQRHFVIVFNGQYDPYLTSNVKIFKLKVHDMLSEMTNASFIRFQQPQVDYGLTNVYVIMTIVDPPPIDAPYRNEPDTYTVLNTLNDIIYRGMFNITVPQSDGTIYTFNATAITDNILRTDGRPLSSKTMSHFKVMKNKSQKGTVGFLSGISVDECAESCLSEIEFDCFSFVYCGRTGTCFTAKTYAQERPDVVYDRPNCDLYYRSYVDKFTAVPGQTSAVSSSQTSVTATADVCAKTCLDDKSRCNSFVYCQVSQTCALLQTHNLDVAKSISKTDDNMCSFYSRSYLNDFQKKARRTIQFTQVLDIEAVSVDQCAKLCIDTEAFSCNSFAFCGNTTTCRLTPAHPTRGMGVVATDYCDLYTRTYYSNQPSKTQASNSSKGYSKGAMAGVAVALLLIGLVAGGGLIILLSKRKKLPPAEIFNMNYTGHTESDIHD